MFLQNVAIPEVLQENDTELCSENSDEEPFELNNNDSEESSEENASSGEESEKEDMLSVSSQRKLPQSNNKSLQNQKIIIEHLSENEQDDALNTNSESLEQSSMNMNEKDVSDDPPAKKLCH